MINLVTKSLRLLVIGAAVVIGFATGANAQTAPAADMAAAAPAAADMGYMVAENWEQHKDKMVGDGYGPDLVKNAIPALMGRSTKDWRAGAALTPELVAAVPAGTAIASFAENGEYTNTPGQSQAALFVAPFSKDGKVIGFTMLDQWPKQGMTKTRILYFNKSLKGSNGAYSYSTIRLAQ
ncbi:MAG: BPSL0067 family protein [Candidatus Pacebacteria bacterium]|nr:BPSL0067 family protein [Candidatus Paceibacterota bacterium]